TTTDWGPSSPVWKLRASWKVPSPLPSSTVTVPGKAELATARSGTPSPLKSPTATELGLTPASKLSGARKLGSTRSSSLSSHNGHAGDRRRGTRGERPSARLRLDADRERRKKVVNMVFVSFRKGLTVYRRTDHFARTSNAGAAGR